MALSLARRHRDGAAPQRLHKGAHAGRRGAEQVGELAYRVVYRESRSLWRGRSAPFRSWASRSASATASLIPASSGASGGSRVGGRRFGSLEIGMEDKEEGHGVEGVLSRVPASDRPRRGGAVRGDTGVDALAVAIGTSHGAYKFSHQPDGVAVRI